MILDRMLTGIFEEVTNLDFFIGLATRMSCFYADLLCVPEGEGIIMQWEPEIAPDSEQLVNAITALRAKLTDFAQEVKPYDGTTR